MLLLVLAILIGPSARAEEPFWRAKEKVYQRIENREVIVSVRSETAERGRHRLSIRGGGQVSAPCDEVFKSAQDYETMAKASGYVDRAQFHPETSILEARIAAYGLKSDLSMKMNASDPVLAYEILSGPMKGLKGRFEFLKAGKKCDVGMDGEFSYEKFPIPEFFLRFGMEVMLQRMAGKVRAFAEERYGHH